MISGNGFVINNQYNIGDMVFVRTDPDQNATIITGIKICPNGHYVYLCSAGNATNQFYEVELSTEINQELLNKNL